MAKNKKESRKPHSSIQLRIPLPLRDAMDKYLAAYNKARPLERPQSMTDFIAHAVARALTVDVKQEPLRLVRGK